MDSDKRKSYPNTHYTPLCPQALVSQAVVEQLTENRYMALQRMMAFMTMFHAMARSVANLWPLTFDISRSQSGLRIATTAAPATASDLER